MDKYDPPNFRSRISEKLKVKSIRFFFITGFFVITIQTASAQFFTEEVFTESFLKGQGPFSETRIINVDAASPAQILFLNGSLDLLVGSVGNGSIALNGQVVFSGEDFRIDHAIILKRVPLVAGDNVLNIDLKGSSGGQLTIQILRPFSFPAGTVFVSPDGNDVSGCGSQLTPCQTLSRGLVEAQATAGSQVAVAAGVYLENVVLLSGVNLLGGFDRNFTRRDLQTSRAVIRGDGTSAATVTAADVSAPTVFEGFFVMGPVVTVGNSIGVSVLDSTAALEIRRNIVLGGRAGDGSGEVGAASGPNGQNGASGQAAFAVPQNTAASNPGGAGGVNSGFSQNISGGNGGTARQPAGGTESGDDGANGFGPAPGLGSDAGDDGTLVVVSGSAVLNLPTADHDGSDGTDGGSGLPGSPGSGGFGLGALVSNIWTMPSGGPGGNGSNGSGGGGGGAGGGAESTDASLDDVVGPSGGGGGAGGAGGFGGSGAEGGGSTFGILAIITGSPIGLPVITDNEIYLGIAGRGGKGGDGGVGGNGGQGGLGGSCVGSGATFGCGRAGAGGEGGRGGHGGGSGGGAGGISVGIFSNFVGGYDAQNAVFTSTGIGGGGGKGGFSLGNPGNDGAPGGVFNILEIP